VCRYKRRLHALWSYLRGTDQAPAVSHLRQKVLQGKSLCCAVLCCAVLCCAVLCCAVLCSIVQHRCPRCCSTVAATRSYTLQSVKCLDRHAVCKCPPLLAAMFQTTPHTCSKHVNCAFAHRHAVWVSGLHCVLSSSVVRVCVCILCGHCVCRCVQLLHCHLTGKGIQAVFMLIAHLLACLSTYLFAWDVVHCSAMIHCPSVAAVTCFSGYTYVCCMSMVSSRSQKA